MQYVCVVGSVGVTGGLISDYAVRVYNWWCECGPVSDCACPTRSHKGSLCFTLSVYLCVMLQFCIQSKGAVLCYACTIKILLFTYCLLSLYARKER